jgi:hypothetical protein
MAKFPPSELMKQRFVGLPLCWTSRNNSRPLQNIYMYVLYLRAQRIKTFEFIYHEKTTQKNFDKYPCPKADSNKYTQFQNADGIKSYAASRMSHISTTKFKCSKISTR